MSPEIAFVAISCVCRTRERLSLEFAFVALNRIFCVEFAFVALIRIRCVQWRLSLKIAFVAFREMVLRLSRPSSRSLILCALLFLFVKC